VFSEPVGGVSASDLLINGTPATTMAGGNDTYTFRFPQPPFGNVNITWAAGHGIVDFGIPPNSFNAGAPGATWQYEIRDNVAPTVLYQLPFAGVTVQSLNQIEVNFSEAVTAVNASDLLINNSPASTVTAVTPTQYVFTFPPVAPGTVPVVWAAGHGITDLATMPNAFAGGSWTYHVDPNAELSKVRINELMAANVNGLRDEDNEQQDWVELYNYGTNSVSLAGWSLTDDENDEAKWVFPPVAIPAGGYLVIFCSGRIVNRSRPAANCTRTSGWIPTASSSGFTIPRCRASSFPLSTLIQTSAAITPTATTTPTSSVISRHRHRATIMAPAPLREWCRTRSSARTAVSSTRRFPFPSRAPRQA
jgi:hypothetical protein